MAKKPPIKRIHVNQHNIKANAKNGNQDLPVFTIKMSGLNLKASSVKINGPSELVYKPNSPLACGAKCWIETRSIVEIPDVNKEESDEEVESDGG